MQPIHLFYQFGRKIVAIGRNYAEHAKELGNAVPKSPFFFLKPPSSYLLQGGSIEIPKGVTVHHEVELGLVIGKNGRDVKREDAMDYIEGYVLGIDVTGRSLQDLAKKEGKPWSAAKGFDTWTPISDFIPRSSVPNPNSARLWLDVDGARKQDGSTSDMIFAVPDLVAHVSGIMKLERGDVILTGTPSGVGPIKAGQSITAGLGVGGRDVATIKFGVVDRPGMGMYGCGK
ncbi:hypothetical protein HK101_006375 [Irineochytrium annulatum]|nr:hypothetical protein HK101_006375 [Irineochytrium annulatum]